MKNQFVTYEIALKLKELGFDAKCFMIFNEDKELEECINVNTCKLHLKDYNNFKGLPNIISAPLWQQVIDWLIEKYNIHIYIDFYDGLYGFAIKLNKEKLYNRCGSFEPGFKNYPEAREQAILKAIELCQNKK